MTGLPPNLAYTIAIDKPGEDVHRRMARLLVTPLIRTGWHGRIVVFHNNPVPVLPEGHPGVEEQVIDADTSASWGGMMHWKYKVRDRLNLTGIGKVLFLDCDIIALRPLHHLMLGTWDIYTAPEPGRITEPPFNGYLTEEEMSTLADKPGINSGTIGVRAECYRHVMAEWDRIASTKPLRPWKSLNQHSWNRLLLDTKLRHRHFAHGEVQFPFLHRAPYEDFRRASLIHACDQGPEAKLAFLFGMWAGAFAKDQLEDITAPASLQH